MRIKNEIKRFCLGRGKFIIIPLKSTLEFLFNIEAKVAKYWCSSSHKRLMFIQWFPPNPEFFDHSVDLYYLWQKNRNPMWLERGVYGSLAIENGANILELACGDGFNAKNFYSGKAEQVIACDFDRSAIKTAKKKNPAKNIKYILADIRYNMPEGVFNNIVWDAAIEHFTPEEISEIMKSIKNRLGTGGVLSGYTIVEKSEGKSLSQHEYEFKDKEDLMRFLKPYFKHVTIFETIYKGRHNLYFWASDSTIPFSKNWKSMICK